MLISIVIPIYNVSAYLGRCLEAVVQQTYKKLEIICVNDGSTDDSLAIIEKFAKNDDRILILNKPNAGLPSARKAGVERATGTYIFHLDGDDFLPVNAIRTLVECALKTEADIVLGDFEYHRSAEDKELFDRYKFDVVSNVEFIRWLLMEGIFFIWGKLIRTTINKQINFPLDIQYTEDAIGMIQLATLASKIAKVNQVVYYYIQRPGAFTSTLSKKNLLQWHRSSVYVEKWLIVHGMIHMLRKEFNKYWTDQVLIYLSYVNITGYYRKDISQHLRQRLNRDLLKFYTGNQHLVLFLAQYSVRLAVWQYFLYRKIKHIK